MRIGVTTFVTDETARPEEVAALVEEYELDSLWFPDHTHIPLSRQSSHPREGKDLNRNYLRNLDLFVAMMAAAATTERILIGSAVCLVTERDPIITAKAVASLDQLSSGRIRFGVGAGWNLEELENHGVSAGDRFKVLDERVESLKEIWTNEVATFKGQFVSFDPIWCWPKPVQSPYVPILLGSNGPRAVDRAIRLGTDWMPGYHKDDDYLSRRIEEFLARSERDAEVTLNAPPLDRRRLARLADAGAKRAVFMVSCTDIQTLERQLEELKAASLLVADDSALKRKIQSALN